VYWGLFLIYLLLQAIIHYSVIHCISGSQLCKSQTYSVSIQIFFLHGEGCKQVIIFIATGFFVVGFATGQLWNELMFDCLIGIIENLNFMGGNLVNIEGKGCVKLP